MAGSDGTPTSVGPELLRDLEHVRTRLGEILGAVNTSICSARPSVARPDELAAALDTGAELLGRGVVCRELFTHRALRHPTSLTYVHAMRRIGADVRMAPCIPSRLVLIDDVYALIPTPGLPSTAALVRDEAVIGFLREMFDSMWRQADEVHGDDHAPEVTHEIEMAILREMSGGRTDEAISRRLGISSRTLRRHLSAMLETFGVETRFQLGAVAARLGLVGALAHHPEPD